MAKLTGPLFSNRASGSIGPRLTYSERKSGSQVRFQRSQKDYENLPRMIQRLIYGSAVSAWKSTTIAKRKEFNTLAIGKGISGWNLFLKHWTKKFLSAVWTGASGENSCRALTFDNSYIYAGLYISLAKVVKIDRVTMATAAVWTGPTGENNCLALTFDNSYIYAGLYISPAKVVRYLF